MKPGWGKTKQCHYQHTPGVVKIDLEFLKELYEGRKVLEFWWSQIYYKVMMHQHLIPKWREYILWLKLTNKLTSQNLCIYVSYFPSSTSSREGLCRRISRLPWSSYRNLGTLRICRNLNAKCENLQDISLLYTDRSLQSTGHGLELAWQIVHWPSV